MGNQIPFNPGDHVFAYLRDSGGNQQDLSIQRQRRELQEWAVANNVVFSRWFIDEARSGWQKPGHRQDLARMMEALRNGEDVRGIVVWNYERFFRDVKNAQLYLAEIRSLDYIFHSINDDVPAGPEGVIIEAVKIYQAEQYSAKLSVDISSGLETIFKLYKTLPGTPPVGFKRSKPIQIGRRRNGSPRFGSRWEPDPDKMDLIRLAFQMRANGDGLKAIQDATGLFRSKNSWTTFFPNALYKGVMHYGEETDENYCEPIVSAELWEKANIVGKHRARPGRNRYHPRSLASHFLLSGLVFCQECGSPMFGYVQLKTARHKRLEYYCCSRKARNRDCSARNVPRALLDDQVLKSFEDFILSLENMLDIQERVSRHYEEQTDENKKLKGKLNHRLGKFRQQIDNITAAVADGSRSKALLDKLSILERDAAELAVQIKSLETEIQIPRYTPVKLAEIAEHIKNILAGDDLAKKKNLLRALISRIVVQRTSKAILGMLYYVPPQLEYLRSGTPAENWDIGIPIEIPVKLKYFAPR